MCVLRRIQTECLEQEKVAIGVFHMIVTADDMGDRLGCVITDIGEMEYR